MVSALAAAIISLVPLLYLVDTAMSRGFSQLIDELAQWRTLQLISRSVLLTFAVTVAAVVIGTFAAWVVVMSGIAGRVPLLMLFSLSLAIPSYLSAFAWVSWLPSISGFLGAFVVLTLVCYPYVMLPVVAAMRRIDGLHEEVSHSLGRRGWSMFFGLTLGQIRSSIVGGALLVALYALSDFGAVAAMRYEAFTWVIYGAYRSGFNPSRAAILSLVLISVALALTVAEVSLRGRTTATRIGSGASRMRRQHASVGTRIVALVGSAVVIAAGAGVPIASVVSWVRRSATASVDIADVYRAVAYSFQVGILTSVVAVILAIPVAVVAVRYSSRFTRSLERATYISHALPGIVIAISVVFIGVRTLQPIYQRLPLLVLGQVILFLPLTVVAVRNAIEQSTPRVEEVAKSLGASPLATIARVTVPLALPGILAGGAMTMLSAVKELPTTLLLRPTGTETLATSIWKYSSVSDYASVGPFAIALMILAVVPVAVMTVMSSRSPK